MGATGHLALCSAAAAKPRSGRGPCAAVLGEPLPALDDAGLLVHPSADFAARALVSSEQQVIIPPRSLCPDPRVRNGWRAFAPRGSVCAAGRDPSPAACVAWSDNADRDY